VSKENQELAIRYVQAWGERSPDATIGVDVISVRDGLVARKDSYADWAAYMRQVGMDLGETASA
jgi:hypothetical protein